MNGAGRGSPFSFSNAPAAARAAWASCGSDVNTAEALIVSGRSASCSSSGIGAASVGDCRRRREPDISKPSCSLQIIKNLWC